MSEFTDFHAVLTQAETFSALRGQIERSVSGAYLPLDELPFEALEDDASLQAAWARLPKPVWLKLGIPYADPMENLSEIGPVLRIKVEEDFSTWALLGVCGTQKVSLAVLAAPDRYREATDMVPLYDAAMDLGGFSSCLGVAQDVLKARLVPDGGTTFAELVGIKYEQMLDMELEDIQAGEYRFGLY